MWIGLGGREEANSNVGFRSRLEKVRNCTSGAAEIERKDRR